MFRFTKQVFIVLLSFTVSLDSIANTPGDIKLISLNNQQFVTQPTLNNLRHNEYIEGLCYYPFASNLDRCIGTCNTLNDLSNQVCVSNKTKDLNLSVFNIMT